LQRDHPDLNSTLKNIHNSLIQNNSPRMLRVKNLACFRRNITPLAIFRLGSHS